MKDFRRNQRADLSKKHRHRFQLRPKPMNKLTAMALKVNCSVKFHS
ncbi:MAG: hypothetical protein OXB88_03260 [Bacteriovoracales bacterium]|nr:hypothetical protein [Bacteriovoracales bacterium]